MREWSLYQNLLIGYTVSSRIESTSLPNYFLFNIKSFVL